jgi:nucleotide-binding universal stress UspA family protein
MIGSYEHIVVGVDGTLASDEACRVGCAQAALYDLPLALVHAWQPTSIYLDGSRDEPPVWGSEAVVRAAARQVLERAVALTQAVSPDLKYEVHLVERDTCEALEEFSRQAVLTVVGGRERARHDLSWLGSTPLHLVTRAHSPVLVVPTDPRLTGDVVVGFESSPLSEAVLGFAFEQATLANCGVRAVAAVDTAFARLRLDSRHSADLHERTRRTLSDELEPFRTQHPTVSVDLAVSSDHPFRALRQAADDARLLVVGSHGRGFLQRHALGSVSAALLRVSTCPIAVIGPDVTRLSQHRHS